MLLTEEEMRERTEPIEEIELWFAPHEPNRGFACFWHCTPPPYGSAFRCIEQGWEFFDDYNARHIYDYELDPEEATDADA